MGKLKPDLTPAPKRGPASQASRFIPASQSYWLGPTELLQNDHVFVVHTYRCSNPLQFEHMVRELADFTLANRPDTDLVLFRI